TSARPARTAWTTAGARVARLVAVRIEAARIGAVGREARRIAGMSVGPGRATLALATRAAVATAAGTTGTARGLAARAAGTAATGATAGSGLVAVVLLRAATLSVRVAMPGR